MSFDFEEREYETAFDALIGFLDSLPKSKVKMINIERYKKMMEAAAELKDILAESSYQGEIEISIYDEFNMGTVKTRLDDLTVMNTAKFAAMIAKADNFEIYPRTDGKIQLAIAFQSVLKSIA